MLISMTCNDYQRKICPFNQNDCNGSCSLREDLTLQLPWDVSLIENKNIKEKITMTEFEKVDTSLENGVSLEINEEFLGEFVAEQEGNYGPNWVLKKDGENHTVFGKTILNTAMIRAKLQPGDTVKIIRKDDIKTGTGRMAQNYEVFVKRKGD